MSTFQAFGDQLGQHELAVLGDDERGRRVRIARRGATVLGIEVRHAGQRLDLADGYRDAEELEQRSGSRFAMMAPFANRVANATYTFAGVVHDLQPGVDGAARAARHGFVRDGDFAMSALAADRDGARVRFDTAIRPHDHPGYPFAIDLAIQYTLDACGLTLEARMHNVGDTAAPCWFGWHPYFRLGHEAVDAWQLQIAASTLIETDAHYIPLPGEAAYRAVDDCPTLDFRRSQPIGTRELNHAYADLAAESDGRRRAWLRHPGTGLALAVWQDAGVLLAFSADTVSRDARRSVALEPMESLADAFNRPECAGSIVLAPGTSRRFRCGVELHTA